MRRTIIIALAFVLLFVVACENAPTHNHVFSTELSYDAKQHYYICECSEKKDAEDHVFEELRIEPTCAAQGSKQTKCKICGYVKSTEVLPKLEHTPSPDRIIVDPTCSKEGSSSIVCGVCKEVLSTTPIDKLPHIQGEEEIVKQPTCAEPGEKKIYCSVCKAEYMTETIPSTEEHDWSAWEVNQEKQEQTRHCNVCAATETSGLNIIDDNVMQKALEYEKMYTVDPPLFKPEQIQAMDPFEFIEGDASYWLRDIKVIFSEDGSENMTVMFNVEIDGDSDIKYEANVNADGLPLSIKKNGEDVTSSPVEKEKFLSLFGHVMEKGDSLYYVDTFDGEVEYEGKTYIVKFYQREPQNSISKRDLSFKDKSTGVILLSFCMEGQARELSSYLSEGGYDNATISRFVVDGVYYRNESVSDYLKTLRQ